jgi:hypothetical protein
VSLSEVAGSFSTLGDRPRDSMLDLVFVGPFIRKVTNLTQKASPICPAGSLWSGADPHGGACARSCITGWSERCG